MIFLDSLGLSTSTIDHSMIWNSGEKLTLDIQIAG